MRRSIYQEETYRMKFKDCYEKYYSGRLSSCQASELLGISERTFLRKRRLFESENFDGRFDLRIGKTPSHKASDQEIKMVTALYQEKFRGFSVKHFHEYAVQDYHLKRSYGWVKDVLFGAGLIKVSTRGGKHRLRRERRPMAGMMVHQDGSTHAWIEGLGRNLDLIVTMDDATSKITSAFLVEEEGTWSSFQGIRETIEKFGLFCTLYTDRGSHYFITPKAGGRVSKSEKTQFGRALSELKIRHLASYCPQGRGRSERMFGTLQGRLPNELRLAGIKDIEAANRYIREVYLPKHNAQFSIAARESGSAYLSWHGDLDEILCIKSSRVVAGNNCIKYKQFELQIPQNEHRHHYVKERVEVHEYGDRSMAIFYGHHCLGRYDSAGNLRVKEVMKNDVAA